MNPLTSDQQRNFEISTHCHICTKELNPYTNRKVKYNGNAVHYRCRNIFEEKYKSAYLDKSLFDAYKQTKECFICHQPLTLYTLKTCTRSLSYYW